MKHLISSKAICPFYRHEEVSVVYCDGVQDGSVVHLAFANRSDARCYKKSFCQKEYEHCYIYDMLIKVYEDGENNVKDSSLP